MTIFCVSAYLVCQFYIASIDSKSKNSWFDCSFTNIVSRNYNRKYVRARDAAMLHALLRSHEAFMCIH